MATATKIPKLVIENEYTKYASMSEADLFKKNVRTNFGLTRNIDLFVNALYWCNTLQYLSTGFPIEMHLKHQNIIITMLTAKFRSTNYSEYKNLNDPTRPIESSGHYYITGRTGFMTSLLINCQFLLYDYFFIKHNVEVNVYDDSFIIFLKLMNINIEEMPDVEIDAIKRIFKKYKTICGDCPFVNPGGYEEFIDIYEAVARNCKSKEWYKQKYGEKYHFTTIIENGAEGPISELINRDKTYYKTKDVRDILFNLGWEYYPRYYKNGMALINERDVSPDFMRRIRDFLIEDTTTFESKYLKYKMKYLALKKLLEDQSKK
jgi:hypothetical protein